MTKPKLEKNSYYARPLLLLAAGLVLAFGFIATDKLAGADQFDEQIRLLQQKNAKNRAAANELAAQASSYQDAINKLEAEIYSLQQAIEVNRQKSNEIKLKIAEAEAELQRQKKVLGQSIKAMYLEGQISTIEILASSRDLSDFVDKEQYRYAVQDKIKDTLAKIKELKIQLDKQQTQLEAAILSQQKQRDQLNATQAEQNELLAYTETQKANYDQRIKTTNAQINELKRQQAIENMRLFGGGSGIIGGGGYPWGGARCIHTGSVDGWCPNYDWGVNGSIWNPHTGGYGYRNCTDWVSYRVRSTGRFVPGGLGNANSWDDRAPSFGFTVSSEPKAGAAAVSNRGFYGHVMYVEAVNEDGTILISDYNRAGTGRYNTSTISATGLRFVYF